MGIDIRLLVPGEGRCLMCLGGLADPSGARLSLRSAAEEERVHAGRDWQRERAGSLRSLNQLAAALAVRLWEDFVAERVRESRWLHIEFDTEGHVQMTRSLPSPVGICPLCRLLGCGEGGLLQAAAFLRGDLSV